MRRLAGLFSVLAAMAVPCLAGFVGGVVVDHVSGRPLPRAVVTLTPVAGGRGEPVGRVQTVRAGAGGSFSFGAQPGLYLLVATRESYFPAGHGSRRATGSAVPIEVTDDPQFRVFSELRMRRKGGVTGYVFDENGVPMAGIPVVAYRARMPLLAAGRAISDDRGIYRIGGLEPGKYWVRSGAERLNDTSSWLPTFGPGTRERTQAKVHAVSVDGDTAYADINAEPGQLFSLRGQVTCPVMAAVTVTLSSETGSRVARTACNGGYVFENLSPAAYEISAETEDGGYAGYVEVALDRDSQSGTVELGQVKPVDIVVQMAGSTARAAVEVTVLGRRQSPAELGEEMELPRAPGPKLAPGFWQIRAAAPAGYYVQGISSSGDRIRNRPRRAVDGFEVYLPPRQLSAARVTVTLSDRPGRIAGKVTTGNEAEGARRVAAGAPVYLVPATDDARRGLGGVRSTVTDAAGRYAFEDLPPGDYRLLASFDVADVEDNVMDAGDTRQAAVKAGEATEKDLTLWRAPGF